jgi:hypothetical protein
MQTIKTSIAGKYDHYPTTFLLEVFAKGPERVQSLVKGLSEQDLKAHSIDDKWSIQEIIIHLADAEIQGAFRIRQVYAKHPGPLSYYQQAIWADVLQYNQQPVQVLEDNLALFTLLRKTTLSVFQRFTAEDWNKTGVHPERGELTLRQFLELYADHSERHAAQIIERKKLLNKPVTLDLLLKERLY